MAAPCKQMIFLVALAVTLVPLMVPASVSCAEPVAASTSLTAAIARAAGAPDVRVLTPVEAKHPPEYELRPSDLLKLEGVGVVVYAGYERMVSRLVETSKNKGLSAIQVNTTLSPDNIIAQTRKIANAIKTEKAQQLWEKRFLERLQGLKARLAPFSGKRAVVHVQARAFAAWAGLSVAQSINPGEVSPKAITDAIAGKPDIVVDILHFPSARLVAENARCPYALLINFPGTGGTLTIEDVFEYNTAQIERSFPAAAPR